MDDSLGVETQSRLVTGSVRRTRSSDIIQITSIFEF